ncbi:transmembrane protein 53-like [Ptychodera flava]|uniref:transmembrane protein 53-like n=1 Tax=Ptychodera flava TaxID=63121 RepID=UPI00396A9D58
MPKPLVLLFSWMAAKQKHLEKFAEYYLNRQCDVLSIQISPGQLLFPERGSQVIAENVVEFVQQDNMKHRQLMVHAFSVGAYLYTEVVQKMQSMAKHEVEILQRIACQVYDSPVDVNNVPEGLSKAVTENPILQFTFRKSIEAYLKMLHNMATRHYNVASKTFFASPVTAPSLFFYSKKDPIGNPATVEKAISSLRDKMGYTVYGKCFEDSLHVSHLYKYPDEYFSTLDSFYNQLDYFKEN